MAPKQIFLLLLATTTVVLGNNEYVRNTDELQLELNPSESSPLSAEPGSSVTLAFTLKNNGAADDFTIQYVLGVFHNDDDDDDDDDYDDVVVDDDGDDN